MPRWLSMTLKLSSRDNPSKSSSEKPYSASASAVR